MMKTQNSIDSVQGLDRIMLRFRPIAPKPAGLQIQMDDKFKRQRRIKRRKRSKICGGRSERNDLFLPRQTLQLLPERPEAKTSAASSVKDEKDLVYNDTGRVIETIMVVESVRDAFDGGGPGVSDTDRVRSLESDTCPGFVSDGMNNVLWVNEAYRRTMGDGKVVLVLKKKLPDNAPGFTCKVRMSQCTKRGYKWNKLLACDGWRMKSAWFAWRMDAETALGLAPTSCG